MLKAETEAIKRQRKDCKQSKHEKRDEQTITFSVLLSNTKTLTSQSWIQKQDSVTTKSNEIWFGKMKKEERN